MFVQEIDEHIAILGFTWQKRWRNLHHRQVILRLQVIASVVFWQGFCSILGLWTEPQSGV